MIDAIFAGQSRANVDIRIRRVPSCVKPLYDYTWFVGSFAAGPIYWVFARVKAS